MRSKVHAAHLHSLSTMVQPHLPVVTQNVYDGRESKSVA